MCLAFQNHPEVRRNTCRGQKCQCKGRLVGGEEGRRGGGEARETGTMWQIRALTCKPCTFCPFWGRCWVSSIATWNPGLCCDFQKKKAHFGGVNSRQVEETCDSTSKPSKFSPYNKKQCKLPKMTLTKKAHGFPAERQLSTIYLFRASPGGGGLGLFRGVWGGGVFWGRGTGPFAVGIPTIFPGSPESTFLTHQDIGSKKLRRMAALKLVYMSNGIVMHHSYLKHLKNEMLACKTR